MRIISGKYRGRILVDCSKLKDLRPTTDRNRESLFNILNSSKILKEINFDLSNANLLDLFCGSGAVSFEALSRGIKSATLIDNNAKHLQIAKQNSEILKETNVNFFQNDLSKPLFTSNKKYNFIFIDPPYSQDLIHKTLDNLVASKWMEDGALIVIEHAKEELIKFNERFELLDQRQYGISIFTFLHFLEK